MKRKLEISNLYQVKREDLKKCATVAAKALLNDKSSQYLLKDSCTYDNLYRLYYIILKACYEQSYLFAPSKEIEGIIVLSSPYVEIINILKLIKAGIISMLLTADLGFIARSLSYKKNCENIRKKVLSKSSWYIFLLGVNPELQGQGFASKIMRPILNWFDENNEACYLETYKESNVKMYQHFGFKLLSTDTLPDNVDKQYAMLRG